MPFSLMSWWQAPLIAASSGDVRWKTQPILIVTHVDDVKIIANQQDADAFIDHFRQLCDIKGFSSPQQFQDERALTMSALPNDLRFSGG